MITDQEIIQGRNQRASRLYFLAKKRFYLNNVSGFNVSKNNKKNITIKPRYVSELHKELALTFFCFRFQGTLYFENEVSPDPCP